MDDLPADHGAAARDGRLLGALLAFALSFDEIIVTLFTAGPATQTIPMFIFSSIQRPNELPVVNVVAFVLILAQHHPGLAGAADQRRRDRGGAALGSLAEGRRVEPWACAIRSGDGDLLRRGGGAIEPARGAGGCWKSSVSRSRRPAR